MVQGLQSISTSADDDAFAIKGHARTEHLARALKQVMALVTDAAFRSEGHESMASNLRGLMNPLWEQPEGPVQRFILPSLASGDPRIGIPDPNVVFAHTSEDLRAWLEPQLQNGPIEIAVVGDVDVDTVIAAVAETFGTLSTRAAKASPDSYRKVHVSEQSVSTYYYYTGPAERPSTLEFFWPIRENISPTDHHRLWMLALILEDRLSVEVREKRGATYSPRAFYMHNEIHQDFSFLRCALEVRAEDAVRYGDVVRGLADKLAKAGVKADELARAKAQYSAGMKASITENPFWLSKISAAQERPASLDALLSAADDIARTSTKNLDALARKYLRADQGFRYIIEPNARMPKPK
jgi:zinc protease